MRRMMALVTAVLVLCGGCGVSGEMPVPNTREASAAVEAWVDCGGWAGERLEMQTRLARWYNLNLRSGSPEPGFSEAYGNILAGPGGMMGWLEFPNREAVLPLFHESGSGEGFCHQKNTPFPIGDDGTTVLRLNSRQPVLWAGWLAPEPGQVFRIHILDRVLTYRIGSLVSDGTIVDTSAVEDGCVLIFSESGTDLLVLGIREE